MSNAIPNIKQLRLNSLCAFSPNWSYVTRKTQKPTQHTVFGYDHIFAKIQKISLTSPIVIKVPSRAPLAVETKSLFIMWLANLNNKSNVCKQVSSKLLFLGHRSLIKKITQTAVINIVFQRIFIKLDVSYASQHTFSKVTVTIFKNYIYIYRKQ